MKISSLRFEFFALLLNRISAPLMVFSALYIFIRSFDEQDVTKYLLAYSAIQWGITAAFQWQKNVYVQTFNDVSEGSSLSVFIAFFIAFSIVFFTLNFHQGVYYSLYMTLYCLSIGCVYYLGIALRMRGEVTVYVYGDTVSTILRWLLSIFFVCYFLKLDMFFLSLFLLGLPLIFIYSFYFKKLISHDNLDLFNNRKEFFKICSLGVLMIIFDFSSSGMLYVDRFFISESEAKSYLVHATVGTQISSIFFGAFVSSFYPRLKNMGIEQSAVFLQASIFKLAKISAVVLCVSVFVAPLIIYFLDSYVGDFKLLFLFSISQMFHFFSMLIFGFYAVFSSCKFFSYIYLVVFLVYLLLCYMLEGYNGYIFAGVKASLMLIMFVIFLKKYKLDFSYVQKPQT